MEWSVTGMKRTKRAIMGGSRSFSTTSYAFLFPSMTWQERRVGHKQREKCVSMYTLFSNILLNLDRSVKNWSHKLCLLQRRCYLLVLSKQCWRIRSCNIVKLAVLWYEIAKGPMSIYNKSISWYFRRIDHVIVIVYSIIVYSFCIVSRIVLL